MDLGVAGRSALVAGASEGLGFAVAQALAAEGADVAICGRDPDKLDRAAAELSRGADGHVRADALDVTDHDAVRAWVDAVAADRGRIDVVVPNAGGPPVGPATAWTVQDYRDALELNLLSSIAMVEATLPYLRANGWGRIVFVVSISAKEPVDGLALSNVSRPGVLGYARSLVQELGDSPITVNCLLPGYHRTPRVERNVGSEDAIRDLAERRVPLARLGRPSEFAAVAAFLASEPASYVHGVAVPVDGGAMRGLL